MASAVTAVAPAPSAEALTHFEAVLRFETDSAALQATLSSGAPDIVLVDVRDLAEHAHGHIPGAISLPRADRLEAEALAAHPAGTVFVVYDAGHGSLDAHRAAARFARLGRPVKRLAGGFGGWLDAGYGTATLQAGPNRGDGP